MFEAFIRDRPTGPLPPDALAKLKAQGREHSGDSPTRPAWRRSGGRGFERAAEAFVATEAARRAAIRSAHVEISGEIAIGAPAGAFTLTGKAGPIDVKHDGSAEILDYKTGSLPRVGDVDTGFNPQLALEGLMLRRGGFEDCRRTPRLKR